MKVNEKIIEMINIWNQISSCTFTYEVIGSKLYIRNSVKDKAVTELYGMVAEMVKNCICKIDSKGYELTLIVWEI